MQNKTERKVRQYHRARRQRVRACAALTVLALVVSMSTGLALIKPAATMENTTYCGIEAHIHNEECFEPVLICTDENREGHAHTDACWGYPCGLEEREGHTHNEECYSLGCGMTEAHVHTDCVDCTLAEAHTHDESCYEQTSTLICGLEESAEHAHGESCYETQTNVICGKAEIPEHIHSEACKVLVCGQEECEAHSHELCGEMVLICGLEEEEPYFTDHVHDPELCYEQKLICEKEEHEHVDACYVAPVTYCGLEEHFHSEFCVDENGLLVCGMENHVHVDECFVELVSELMQLLPAGAEVPADYTEEYSFTGEQFAVAVFAPVGALPEGAVLVADLLDEWTEEYAEAEAAVSETTEFDGMVAMDIRFELNEEEIEPSAPVYVCINAIGLLPEEADPETVAVQHHTEEEVMVMGFIPTGEIVTEATVVADAAEDTGIVEAAENYEEAATDVVTAFEVESFSTFTVTWTESGAVLRLHYVDTNGKISNDSVEVKSVEMGADGSVNLAKFAGKMESVASNYQSAYIVVNDSRIPVTAVRYGATENQWYYTADGTEEKWVAGKTAEAYLVFETIVVAAVDDNITINLFDYGNWVNKVNETVMNFFVSRDGQLDAVNPQRDGYPIMAPVMVNGYPYVDKVKVNDTTNKAGGSLEYLFKPEDTADAANYLKPADQGGLYSTSTTQGQGAYYTRKFFEVDPNGTGTGLFQLGEDGYYRYSSGDYSAYFNKEMQKFELYDYYEVPSFLSMNDIHNLTFDQSIIDKNGLSYENIMNYFAVEHYNAGGCTKENCALCLRYGNYDPNVDGITTGSTVGTDNKGIQNMWWKGFGENFLPFDRSHETGTVISAANGVNSSHTKPVYQVAADSSTPTNMWFGMSMEFTFYMPKDGKMNGEDMIFEFFGDDDVMLYIDDVLVLDMSGDHYSSYGAVNFATGDVIHHKIGLTSHHYVPDDYDLFNLREKFTNAMNYSIDGKSTITLDDFADGENTFEDYTIHTAKFYYLERGGMYSYCDLQFNMPTLPANSLTVQKEVLRDPNAANKTFTFEIELKDGENQPHDSVTYTDQDGKTGTVTLNESGIGQFMLKDDEFKTFDLQVNDQYVVGEIATGGSSYDTSWSGTASGTMNDSTPVYLVCYNELIAGEIETDKTVSGTTTENMYLTLDAFATGETITTSKAKPTDIILVLDQSGSMYDAVGRVATGKTITLANGEQSELAYKISDAINYTQLNEVGDKTVYGGQHRGYYMMINDDDKTIWCVKYDASQNCWVKYSMTPKSNGLITGEVKSHCTDNEPEVLTQNDHSYGVFYKSIYGESCDALLAFLNSVNGEQNIRIGVVGFASATYPHTTGEAGYSEYYGTGVYQNGSFVRYTNILYNSSGFKEDVFEDTSTEAGMNALYASLVAYEPKYNQTATSVGLRIAQEMIRLVTKPNDTGRAPVIILFTDGEPTVTNMGHAYPGKDHDLSAGDRPTGAEAKAHAIALAEELKTGVCTDKNKQTHYKTEIYALAPTSENISRETLEKIASPGKVFTASAGNLPDVFETVAESVTSSTASLTDTAILQDVISDEFQLDVDASKNRTINVKLAAYNGSGFETAAAASGHSCSECGTIQYEVGTMVDGKFVADADQTKPTGNVIQVTGFDYSAHYVTTGVSGGYKIVVEIPIKPADSNKGGTHQATNDDEKTGIFDGDEKVVDFPEPHADVPTTVTVKKTVQAPAGTTITQMFDFTAAYKVMGQYTNTPDGDSNYLEIPETTWVEGAETKFQLTADGTKPLAKIPLGSTVKVEEPSHDGFHLSIKVYDADGNEIGASGYTRLENGVEVTVRPGMTIEFINSTGAVLPSTGGMGTTVFYIVGAVLMLGAVVFLVARKKMGKEE